MGCRENARIWRHRRYECFDYTSTTWGRIIDFSDGFPGIRDRDTRVAEIVTRELQKANLGKWGYVQARELWSPKEERQVCPGHF